MDMSLFGGVSAEDYTRMLTCLGTSPRTFRAGEVVLRYGDSKNIGIVESGCIRLERTDASGQRAILERVEAGGIFGEVIAFSGISKDSYTFLSEGNSAVFAPIYHDRAFRLFCLYAPALPKGAPGAGGGRSSMGLQGFALRGNCADREEPV